MRSMAGVLRDNFPAVPAGENHSCKPPAVPAVAVAIHRVFAPMALHDAAQVGVLCKLSLLDIDKGVDGLHK